MDVVEFVWDPLLYCDGLGVKYGFESGVHHHWDLAIKAQHDESVQIADDDAFLAVHWINLFIH